MKEELLKLAERCETGEASFMLDADISKIDPTYRGGPIPAYTGSLDAAKALVPEKWDWGIAHFGPRGSEAQAWPHGALDSADKVVGSSDANVAAALCAAALRARAANA